ncbi:MAG TPA: hypothetical protein VJ960_09365 [Oceanipulchritudo sp.]|nr:hypothetical protein [Oceanipulchritudo sp.]
MNPDKDRSLEERLGTVQPRPVNPALKDAVRASLRRRERQVRLRKIRSGFGWTIMAAAAMLLISFGFLLFNGRLALLPRETDSDGGAVTAGTGHADPKSERDMFNPVLAENNLQSRTDEGIVFLRNGLTARRYRYEFVDRVVWRNPTSGAVVEMEVPREEVILVPVQTF